MNEAEANSKLMDAAPELYQALKFLRNEVKGCWSLSEPSIRSAIGNTNYACVLNALEIANAALTKADGEARKMPEPDEMMAWFDDTIEAIRRA